MHVLYRSLEAKAVSAQHCLHLEAAPSFHCVLVNSSRGFSVEHVAQTFPARARPCNFGLMGLQSRHWPVADSLWVALKELSGFCTPQALQVLVVASLDGKCSAKAACIMSLTSSRESGGRADEG